MLLCSALLLSVAKKTTVCGTAGQTLSCLQITGQGVKRLANSRVERSHVVDVSVVFWGSAPSTTTAVRAESMAPGRLLPSRIGLSRTSTACRLNHEPGSPWNCKCICTALLCCGQCLSCNFVCSGMSLRKLALPFSSAPYGYAPSRGRQRPTDPAFPKSARVAIIGAGPAGLTMANELQKRGYSKV